MYNFKINKISKNDFLKLNEDDVMFITNPGRMGDENGTTFIIKKENNLIVYRVDGWMYPDKSIPEDEYISLNDTLNQFPKWHDTWNNWNEENYSGKYKYLYMGFGNGLSVDNSIYEEFKPYLDKEITKNLEKYSEEEKKDMQYAAVYNVWDKALISMAKEKNYILK